MYEFVIKYVILNQCKSFFKDADIYTGGLKERIEKLKKEREKQRLAIRLKEAKQREVIRLERLIKLKKKGNGRSCTWSWT